MCGVWHWSHHRSCVLLRGEHLVDHLVRFFWGGALAHARDVANIGDLLLLEERVRITPK
jgi:hypothetical protein